MRRRSNNKSDSLDTWIKRVIRKDERELAKSKENVDGLVVGVTNTSAAVETERGILEARLTGKPAVVGDAVTVAILENGDSAVLEVAARRTKLSRPDVDQDKTEQVIVANVDIVTIVVSVVTPPLHPRLIDRYLVAIQQGGAQPLIYVNKLDLLEDHSELDVLDTYRNLGIQTIQGSAHEGLGRDDLRTALRGKTCAFVGHSGVGKSSLVNLLKPEADLDTGALMGGYGRGAHTTTTSSLHRLADGTVLIDTPGIRSFGLRELDGSEIASYFPEFAPIACKFNDCSHIHEPGCGVLEAVESGEIDEARYDAYVRLREELG